MKHDAVTWLDFRADDLSQARNFIRSLQEEGVIDELGFLALLGRFSDLLHPATTTLMRSARYFYFVAGIYRRIELEGVHTSQVSQLARQRQDELRDVLAAKETVGVIGREAGIDLRQFPSLIYWSGLRKLGIFTSSLSESAYQEQFDDIRRSHRGYQDDDKTAQGPEGAQYWCADLPPARFLNSEGLVKSGETFKLTKAEALDLHKRFTSRFPDSLLSHMLAHRLVGIQWPWDCPKASRELRVWLGHARNMSLLVRGATLQYYSLLIEELDKLGIQSATNIVQPVFEQWWDEARDPLKNWSTSEFVTVPTVSSALRPGNRGDRWFDEYVRQPEVADPEKEVTKRLETFKRLLHADQIRGEYDSNTRTLRLLEPSTAGAEGWPAGMCAQIVPLLQRDHASRADYRLVYGSGALFTGIELEDVAAFAYIVISNVDHKDIELPFVIQFELNLGARDADDRDNAVNARLLEGVDARSLLLDILAGRPGGTSRSSGNRQYGSGQSGEPLLRRATIERILEACTADPSRTQEVEAVLAASGDTANMSTFREFWAVFRSSLEEENASV
ncbi:MAG: DUF6361 family protein [Bradyrhizobium sp.]|uniref:DUF6361 family protein n=1 Tax=Bradyrhizobium sp. TaxID=376 RepID=UPI0027258CB6|nr:DUF6361 family protein [Bradyrhizobium sp.]MDO8397953.1 DUF6361 family protein [Bradyrhizobium sp.]